MKAVLLFLLCCFSLHTIAQDSAFIKVHFLYGSKPALGYKNEEQKWFGGKLGGILGMEVYSSRVPNFMFRRKFHLIASKQQLHSAYSYSTIPEFYSILVGHAGSMKKANIYVPVSAEQKRRFDSIAWLTSNRTVR